MEGAELCGALEAEEVLGWEVGMVGVVAVVGFLGAVAARFGLLLPASEPWLPVDAPRMLLLLLSLFSLNLSFLYSCLSLTFLSLSLWLP